jgi:capsular exopolysaccharide synthesis family protein
LHGTGYIPAQGQAHFMSSTLGLHTTNAARLVDGAPPLRLAAGRRVITVRPGKKSRLVFLTEPDGLAVEQYKMLRRRLCTLHPTGGAMLITSPSPGEGKTLTSVNLAWCLAEAGHRTCLVDLDFRAPGVAPTLGYSFDEDGVEDVLAGKRTISQSIRQLGERSLYVLGVRKRLVSPGELLSPASLAPLLTDLRAMFQWIILDFAPIIPMADVAEVIPFVDGALMVLRSGKTDRSVVEPSLEILGPKLLGVVVNDSPINGSSYYGYYGNNRKD